MNKKRKNVRKQEDIEDTTMYGEHVPSFDNWITMDKQRKRVKQIENITKGNNN